jgi:putative protease
MTTRPELLAPAGDITSLRAAVENGADAVYLGAQMLSARASAANFTPDELVNAIEYAHLKGVRAYITVNTLVKDSEIEDAADLLCRIDDARTDGVIVQDVGLIPVVHSLTPGLPIHASTQMTLHNSEGIRFLQESGVKRIVLAREMTLDAIKRVRQKTDLEIEVFVHGALCISYSGQCLLSSMIGGRSGNRGVCAQPCRKQYWLRTGGHNVEVDGEYLLSPKDLNTTRILPELINAGIDSFKIEGRLKRPEYVACTVRIYRRLIDRYMEDPAGYFVSDDESRSLTQVFNRGFTTGYLTQNQRSKLISRSRPYNRGVPIGMVVGNSLNHLRIRLSGMLNIGDGIGVEGTTEAKDGTGTIIHRMYADCRQINHAGSGMVVDIPAIFPTVQILTGSTVYKSFDKQLMDSLSRSFTSPAHIRRIPVTIKVKATVGSPLEVLIEDADHNTVCMHSEYIIERALSRPTTEREIIRQLTKLGNTVFVASKSRIDIQINGEVFIPIGELNRIRNDALSQLADIRITGWRRDRVSYDCSVHTTYITEPALSVIEAVKKPSLSVTVNSMDGVRSAVDGGADIIYLNIERYYSMEVQTPAPDLETAIRYVHHRGRRIYLNTPRIATDLQMRCISETLSSAKRLGTDGILVSNHGVFRLAREIELETVIDSAFNVFNRNSLQFWTSHGAGMIVLSPELTLAEIREIAKCGMVECIVHGRLTLLESEHCVVGGILGGLDRCTAPCKEGGFELVDEKGYAFPLRMDMDCRMHLLNSSELCMLDHIPEIVNAGVSSIRIETGSFTSDHIKEITRLYRTALDGCFVHDNKTWMMCRDLTKQYTTGHYIRGVY